VVWAEESGAIILKVRQPFGDTVELGEAEALELGEAEALELGELLVRLAQDGL
jgi:hypothetical protein